MPDGLRGRALREFGVTAGSRPPDAQSGAGVWAVRTAAGQPAYLSHPSNLLHSRGGLVFCDWQSAGIGRPAADLAFLSVRATPAGMVVPPGLIDAYVAARRCDRRALRRAVVAEEIAVLLGQWPAYARLHDAAGVGRVVRRARELSRVWLTGGEPLG